ncbi:3-hydroxyacyl-CoA dehydrogenase [Amycolatopsis bartoniae]|uniref:Signal transduction histidine kinase subgroup 3 dimerisation and phosphoacceptor domain-containing protein n=1 Tax=Amycolatopsis bartoniae TaxID=941986 RepID=A0A8H9IU38_9PSEU|nr:histidine kinase [Amycolatopsis bartoniae]MBB2938174.1 3-hydroxyacyl-CoA dehydrogenase [Amycolatopsis bartoniae]GHF33183.1 hypothetical protein GCM10017566_02270 [Amycolatopsis bartoniae]
MDGAGYGVLGAGLLAVAAVAAGLYVRTRRKRDAVRAAHDEMARGLAVLTLQAGVAQATLAADQEAARHALARTQSAAREVLAGLGKARRATG